MNIHDLALASAAYLGCTCEPDIRVITTGQGPSDGSLCVQVLHDDDCPAG